MSLKNLQKLAKIKDVNIGKDFLKNIDVGIPELNVVLKNKNFNIKGSKAFIDNIPITTIVKNFNSGNMGLVLKNLNISPSTKLIKNLNALFEKSPNFNIKRLNDNKIKLKQKIGADIDLSKTTKNSLDKKIKSKSSLRKFFEGVGSIVKKGTTIALLGGIGTFTGLFIDAIIKYKDSKTGCIKFNKTSKGIQFCKILSVSCCNKSESGYTCNHPDTSVTSDDCQKAKDGECCVRCDSTITDPESIHYVDPEKLADNDVLMCYKPTLFDALIDLSGNTFDKVLKLVTDPFLDLLKSPAIIATAIAIVVIVFIVLLKK